MFCLFSARGGRDRGVRQSRPPRERLSITCSVRRGEREGRARGAHGAKVPAQEQGRPPGRLPALAHFHLFAPAWAGAGTEKKGGGKVGAQSSHAGSVPSRAGCRPGRPGGCGGRRGEAGRGAGEAQEASGRASRLGSSLAPQWGRGQRPRVVSDKQTRPAPGQGACTLHLHAQPSQAAPGWAPLCPAIGGRAYDQECIVYFFSFSNIKNYLCA